MKLPLAIKANPLRFAFVVGATVAAITGNWINPLVAAGVGVVSMFPTAWLVSRQIQNEIRRASQRWQPYR